MRNFGKKVLFVANGRSTKLKKIERQLLRSQLKGYKLIKTTSAGELDKIIKDHYRGYDLIVGIGGDGTIHELINSMMSLDTDNLPHISVIPAGTANDFSKTLSFPASVAELEEAINKNLIKSTDIGELYFTNIKGNSQKKYFVNIADCGIGAAVVEEVNQNPSKWGGANITFFKAIINALRKYKNIEVVCETPDWRWKGFMKMFVIANGKTFGSGLMIAPHAKVNDGILAITIGGDISTYDYIKYLPQLKRGQKIVHPQLFYKEASFLKITSFERCPVEADGELIGFTPIEVKVIPGKINFLVLS